VSNVRWIFKPYATPFAIAAAWRKNLKEKDLDAVPPAMQA
jgi:hypothetical protein